jgi:phosphoglycolate phosphatase
MGTLKVRGLTIEADVIVLDKDGTLVDFHHLWARRFRQAVDGLVTQTGATPDVADRLSRAMGFVESSGVTLGTGPLATAPMHEIEIVISSALHQTGIAWETAREHTRGHFLPVMAAPPELKDLVPLGDILSAAKRLKAGGFELAIATTDSREPVLETLDLLRIAPLVSVVLCGDDTHLPRKPAPEALDHIARQFGTRANRCVMIGDTQSDMEMARAAGVAGAIGVIDGACDAEVLAQLADVTVASIDEIYAV